VEYTVVVGRNDKDGRRSTRGSVGPKGGLLRKVTRDWTQDADVGGGVIFGQTQERKSGSQHWLTRAPKGALEQWSRWKDGAYRSCLRRRDEGQEGQAPELYEPVARENREGLGDQVLRHPRSWRHVENAKKSAPSLSDGREQRHFGGEVNGLCPCSPRQRHGRWPPPIGRDQVSRYASSNL